MVLHQITFENRQNIKSLTIPKHLAHFCIFKELLINHHYGGYDTGSCIIFKRKCCFFILFLNKLYEAIIKIKLQQSVGISRPCSHFVDTCRSEMIFVVDTLRVRTAIMLSATQIGTIPFRSKRVSEYFPQSLNNMERNKEF